MAEQLGIESKLKDIYKNPVGKDILDKLLMQVGKSEKILTNPIVGNLRLKTVMHLSRKLLDKQFYNSFLTLLNEAESMVEVSQESIEEVWWKEKIVYQIYPRSFKDSNGDGIGDINGIIEKLDYLQGLGIDMIWLSPIYDSPNDDNGYDIRDYYKIMAEFGTMADFDKLLNEVHKRGMKLIMDLVVNHTSDEHEWFQKAIKESGSLYKDYYLFKEGEENQLPNNWTSYFSGPAWNYYKSQGSWALHLFSKKQMDLNWDNVAVRQEIYKMINWWLEKGIDGFRLDVINYISKREGLPEGNKSLGEMMKYYGVEHYFYGPHLHDYLREMRKETFDKHNAFTVGETPGVGLEMSRQLTAKSRRELDMVFSFDHLEMPGHERFDLYSYDLNYLKNYLIKWMKCYGNDCWMALFYENHDNPRMISKVDERPEYREVLGKLLALIQMTLKGTPFIFQGQELGLINKKFKQIKDFRDIESINLYKELIKTMDEETALKKILRGSRDHSRVPMPWDDGDEAGFTKGTSWIIGDEDYKHYNVKSEMEEENSMYHFYKQLIALRKTNKALVYGEVIFTHEKCKNLFTYYRKLAGKTFYIECNVSGNIIRRKQSVRKYQKIISNYKVEDKWLRPYEANLYEIP